MSIKEFYESDARKRHTGIALTQLHMMSLGMLDIKEKEIVLEVGCGAGALLLKVVKKGANAIGLDISNNQIKYAERHVQNLFVAVANAEKLPLKDKVFSKCLAIEVLEHVLNPNQMIAEIYRVLKDDGELIIVVPNDKNWVIYRILQGHFREAFYDYGHLHDFSSLEKLKPFLKGFKVLMVRENNAPTIPLRGIVGQLFRVFSKISPRQEANVIRTRKDHENAHTRLLTYNNRFSSMAPKLTLHLIIKLKKK